MKIIVIMATLAIFLFSCKKGSTNSQLKVPTIYVGGDVNRSVPLYWENEKEIFLKKDTGLLVGNICVVNGDVYLAGAISSKQGFSKAGYWKNGKWIDLTDGKRTAIGRGITVDGNDIYVCGQEDDTAKYWKNGVPVILSGGEEAISIAVSGINVYAVGYNSGPNPDGALYWINGNLTVLPRTGNFTSAYKIILVGKDVYMAGSDEFKAVYWKNGSEVFVGDGEAYSIAVSNNNVYLAGYNYSNSTSKYIAKYWKNGVDIPIVNSESARSLAHDIAVYGDDVYIAGIDEGTDLDFGKSHPKLWKNQVEESLPQTYDWEEALSITIK